VARAYVFSAEQQGSKVDFKSAMPVKIVEGEMENGHFKGFGRQLLLNGDC